MCSNMSTPEAANDNHDDKSLKPGSISSISERIEAKQSHAKAWQGFQELYVTVLGQVRNHARTGPMSAVLQRDMQLLTNFAEYLHTSGLTTKEQRAELVQKTLDLNDELKRGKEE